MSLALCKAQCKPASDAEDELITVFRDAAINLIEQYCNLRLGLCPGEVATFAGFGERMRVGLGPAAALVVTGISYLDAAGASVAIEAGGWRVDPAGGIVPIGRWPIGAGAVTVTFNAGYPAGSCPPVLRQAVLLFTTYLFENRGGAVMQGLSGEIPKAVLALCKTVRMPVL